MPSSDAEFIAALREGDEEAFGELMDSYNSVLLRVATIHVGSRAVAEEVVQETWLGVIRGLDGFDGRWSLKTWIFRMLTDVASRHGAPEEDLLTEERRGGIRSAIEALPACQRLVTTLRDMEGWRAAEACEALGISQAEQRALLHRARTKVRRSCNAGARARHQAWGDGNGTTGVQGAHRAGDGVPR